MHYTCHTDGSILRNPCGPGSAVTLIEDSDGKKQCLISRRQANTTSNREEMLAMLQALEYLPENSTIEVVSDSEYVVKGFNHRMDRWLKAGLLSDKAPTKNKDLWDRMIKARARHAQVTAKWVRGHSKSKRNNFVDRIARRVAIKGVPRPTKFFIIIGDE